MNRRDFVSRVALGTVAVCTASAKPALAAVPSGTLNVRFLGMMGFIERADHSFLVATPGQHGTHHMVHVPFLMARANSRVARALAMTPVAGVIPAAFDTQLEGSVPDDFVFRNLENTSLEIVSGGVDLVDNRASQMAQLQVIAPGKRVRGNIEKWASTTVSLRGGRLENSAGHPDAGKSWRFGPYAQKLTDAVNFQSLDRSATLRLTSATFAQTVTVAAGETVELWMISAAVPEAREANPKRLVHSELLFDYLVDATPVLAECAEATGRVVPVTELPYARPTSASLSGGGGAVFPPLSEFCYIASILLGTSKDR